MASSRALARAGNLYSQEASLPIVVQWAGEGAPGPLRSPGKAAAAPEGSSGPVMSRTVTANARVTPEELEQWRGKARAAGTSLSELLRQAMVRTRTWTAAARAAERERTLQLARLGSNLNQIARWANTHKAGAEAVEVIAHLVAIERDLRALKVRGSDDDD